MSQDTHIAQKYIRRYPDSKRTRSWAGVLVHIETENGVWRVGGSGYTYAHKPDAWVLPFEEAQRQVNHCGPEKRAAFIRAVHQTVTATEPLPVRLERLAASLEGEYPPHVLADIRTASTLVQSMREALEPFAKLGEEAAWMTKADDKGAWGFDGVNLTWGDFRRALSALAQVKP